MKKGSVLSGLIAGMVLIAAVIGLLTRFIFAGMLEREAEIRLVSEAVTILRSMSYAVVPLMEKGDNTEIQHLFIEAADNKMISQIRLFCKDNTIVNSVNPHEIGLKDASVDASSITKMGQIVSISRDAETNENIIMMPLNSLPKEKCSGEKSLSGVLYLRIDGEYKSELLNGYRMSVWFYIAASVILMTSFVFFYLRNRLIGRLKALVEQTDNILRSDLKSEYKFEGCSEVSNIRDSLNKIIETARRRIDKADGINRKNEDYIRKKTRFYSGVSSYMREPILSLNKLIKSFEEAEEDKVKKSRLSIAANISKELVKVTEEIYDVTKLESSDMDIKKGEFSLPDMILDVFKKYKCISLSNGVDFKVIYIPEKMLSLYGDEKRIRQTLENVLDNVFKFTFKGSVGLYVNHENGILTFKVRDTGVGISEDRLEKVFEVYTGINTDDNKIYGGMGIGLPISKKLAVLMGGDIKVKSVYGEGSEFIIELKADCVTNSHEEYGNLLLKWKMKNLIKYEAFLGEASRLKDNVSKIRESFKIEDSLGLERDSMRLIDISKEFELEELIPQLEIILRIVRTGKFTFSNTDLVKMIQSEVCRLEALTDKLATEKMGLPCRVDHSVENGSEGRNKLRILLAEDSIENRNLVKLILAKYDVLVVEAENGLRALELLKQDRFDAVFLDVHMPVLDGINTLEKIREDRRMDRVRVSMMTASVQSQEIKNYFDKGCNNIIPKPISDEIIKNEIAELTKGKLGAK